MGSEPNHQLRTLLREVRCAQGALAAAVNSAGAEIGLNLTYDRSSVAHWLTGAQPRQPTPRLVAEVLSRRTGRNISVAAAGFREDEESCEDIFQEFAEPESSASEPALARFARLAADPSREEELLQLPYRPTRFLDPAGIPPARNPVVDSDAERHTLLPPQVASIQAAATFFAIELDGHGGEQGRTSLSKYLEDSVAPRLRACTGSAARRELLSQTARLAFILGRMYADTTRHGAAHYCYRMAAELANEAGDLVTWCIITRMKASQAFHLGHRTKAVEYAEAAANSLTTTTPAAVQAFVLVQAAVTRAATHRSTDAYSALTRAEENCGKAPESSDPFASYSMAALSFQAAHIHECLGDLRSAIGALQRSAGSRAVSDRRGHALTQARRGHLLLRTGELEQSCACSHEFLSLSSGLRSHAVRKAIRSMRGDLRPYTQHTRVREVLHRAARHEQD